MRLAITYTSIMVMMTQQEIAEMGWASDDSFDIKPVFDGGDVSIRVVKVESGPKFTAYPGNSEEFKIERKQANMKKSQVHALKKFRFGLSMVQEFIKPLDGSLTISIPPESGQAKLRNNPKYSGKENNRARLPAPPQPLGIQYQGPRMADFGERISLDQAIHAIHTVNKFTEQNSEHVVLSVKDNRIKFLVEG